MFFLVLLLLCFSVDHGQAEYKGSTIGLKKIVLGRCMEYLERFANLKLLDEPLPKLDERERYCVEIREKFLKAFARKDACTVKESDYDDFFRATGTVPIVDRILFWSKHEMLSRAISYDGKRAVILKDTLAGYLTTDLNWCGEVKGKNPDGINFVECPVCRKDPVKDKDKKEHFEVYWGAASAAFAKRAKGKIHHLVNGAVGTAPPKCAFHDKTFFYLHELPNIPKKDVTEFRLIVANEPTKQVHETCGTGTILELQNEIKTKLGKTPVCVVNPAMVMHIICSDYPNTPECNQPIKYLAGKHY